MSSHEPPSEDGRHRPVGMPRPGWWPDEMGAVGPALGERGGPEPRAAAGFVDLDGIDDDLRDLRRDADARPDDALAQARWADGLLDLADQGRRGAGRAARARAGRALDLDPNLPEALLVEARILARSGEWSGAIDALRRAVAGGRGDAAARACDALLGWAEGLSGRDEWLAALPLWREAASVAPARARASLVEVLRAEQDALLAPPRWSWVVYPPAADRGRSMRYAAASFVAAVACLVAFLLLAGRDATLVLSLVPCLGIVLAPVGIWLMGRRRRRASTAPNAAEVAAIQADPAILFRDEPAMPLVLAALEYVAAERQGRAIAAANPWLLGRGSPSERQARRGALLRAPWMPRGEEPDGPRRS